MEGRTEKKENYDLPVTCSPALIYILKPKLVVSLFTISINNNYFYNTYLRGK